jgi:dihydrofolate reductase
MQYSSASPCQLQTSFYEIMNDFDLIVAVASNGVIGNSIGNSIPWYLPRDLQYFKEKTLGRTVAMGSRTWASLPVRPLKGRRNVVISRKVAPFVGADAQYTSFSDVLAKERDVIVIGGGALYTECLKYRPRVMLITTVNSIASGDVRFPYDGQYLSETDVLDIDGTTYDAVERIPMEENGYSASFNRFVRRSDI